ncbi:hypothetical protein LJB99_04355 [Deltaproteobacteria bacterium OttesenSCG-928-K17]|nr:hypothetical protein [Deltaproteobacteria bacterium OttesenSCG-928-K17]
MPTPKFEWGMDQAAVLASAPRRGNEPPQLDGGLDASAGNDLDSPLTAQWTPDRRTDELLHFESYDIYPGRIVETDYRFNKAGQLSIVSFRMRPHWEDGASLEQMLADYRRLLEIYLTPNLKSYGNKAVVTRGGKESVSSPDKPPAPVAADIEAGVEYSFESRAADDAVYVFCYISISENGQASLSISLHSELYK